MAEEKNLNVLLKNMSPQLEDGEYVFISLPGCYGDHMHLEPLGSFMESEGLTLIVPRKNADTYGGASNEVFRLITLNVHSSLNAVGLTSAVSGKLAEAGISANVVAACYHDHIFVKASDAENALNALKELTV